MEIEYFRHQHPLILSDRNGLGCPCSVCEQRVFRGECYSCSRSECEEEVLIHKSCGELEKEIQHPFHPRHPLILRSRSPYFPERFNCDACGITGTGLVYNCAECEFDIHVYCASLMPTISYQGHNHLLTQFQFEHNFGKEKRLCVCCDTPCRSFFFRCVECDFNIHKSCATNLPKYILHPFHPHPLTLTNDMPNPCSGCCGSSLDFYFNCEACNFKLCQECYLLVPNIKYEGHHHLLTLFSKIHRDYIRPIKPCYSCNKPCDSYNKGMESGGFIFRCVECDFSLHPQCLLIFPRTIKHNCHIDPLFLTESIAEEDDFDEFYCDACEKHRNPNEHFYYCAECQFVAELGCVINEILPSIIVEQDCNAPKMVEISDMPTKDDSTILVELDEEIARIQLEKRRLEAELERVAAKLEALEGKRAQYVE